MDGLFALDLPTLVAVMAGAAVACAVTASWVAVVPRNRAAARARGLAARRDSLRAELLSTKRRRGLPATGGVMRAVVTRFNLLRSEQAGRMTQLLARAGFRGQEAMVAYLFTKLAAPIVALIVVALGIHVFELIVLEGWIALAASAGAIVAGAYLPDVLVRNLAARRTQALVRALPDGLDLMVICAEAGLSLDSALARVAGEIQVTSPELADELALTAVELSFLPERRIALTNLSSRAGARGLRALVNTLIQTEKYGTPLAQALRVLAQELRHERMMDAEAKAARLPAILTVPMVIFILPPLFIVLLGPAVLRSIDALGGP